MRVMKQSCVVKNGEITVREVRSARFRRLFVSFPNVLYRDNPYYVPPMYAETGAQLELNDKVIDQWKIFPSRQQKRRRCFIKQLADDKSTEKEN